MAQFSFFHAHQNGFMIFKTNPFWTKIKQLSIQKLFLSFLFLSSVSMRHFLSSWSYHEQLQRLRVYTDLRFLFHYKFHRSDSTTHRAMMTPAQNTRFPGCKRRRSQRRCWCKQDWKTSTLITAIFWLHSENERLYNRFQLLASTSRRFPPLQSHRPLRSEKRGTVTQATHRRTSNAIWLQFVRDSHSQRSLILNIAAPVWTFFCFPDTSSLVFCLQLRDYGVPRKFRTTSEDDNHLIQLKNDSALKRKHNLFSKERTTVRFPRFSLIKHHRAKTLPLLTVCPHHIETVQFVNLSTLRSLHKMQNKTFLLKRTLKNMFLLIISALTSNNNTSEVN